MNLVNKIKDRKSVVCVIGLGYVGLPLIKTFLNTGFQVIGFDIDKTKVNLLNKGKSYIKHVTGKDLIPFLEKNKFKATTDPKMLAKADAILICVPTPLDAHKNPDLSFVLNTTRLIAANRKKGQLVVLESTTYPGTTEEEMLPILESKGYKVGRDFYLAYSPESENPGDDVYTTANIPKVVGGVTRECLKVAKT
ncbi:MAG: NAD(P)-binding domain-containing protein, partial [Candidatus Aminicenantaceae bacterium]